VVCEHLIKLACVVATVVAGCGPASATQQPSRSPATSASPSIQTPEGTWKLEASAASLTISERLLLTATGTKGIELATLDGYPYGSASVAGSVVRFEVSTFAPFEGRLSADGRTITGSGSEIGMDRFQATKVSDAFEKWSDSSSFTASGGLRIPVGRWSVDASRLSVTANGKAIDPQLVRDPFGGYWTSIPLSSLAGTNAVGVRFTRADPAAPPAVDPGAGETFLAPSPLFDSSMPTIVAEAHELMAVGTTREARAKAIFDFVTSHVRYRAYGTMDAARASDTLALGYGACANFSRLFVALARAAGVPARSVAGVFRFGRYDEGHEWAEFLDDAGVWHPMDFTYLQTFDLNHTGFLDLVYDPEENPWSGFGRTDAEPYQVGQDIYIQSSYPLAAFGHKGFREVEGDSSGTVAVENSYTVANDGGVIRFVLGGRPGGQAEGSP
jgi:hypothetical protein